MRNSLVGLAIRPIPLDRPNQQRKRWLHSPPLRNLPRKQKARHRTRSAASFLQSPTSRSRRTNIPTRPQRPLTCTVHPALLRSPIRSPQKHRTSQRRPRPFHPVGRNHLAPPRQGRQANVRLWLSRLRILLPHALRPRPAEHHGGNSGWKPTDHGHHRLGSGLFRSGLGWV